MVNLKSEKILAAEKRIKELQLLIRSWRKTAHVSN